MFPFMAANLSDRRRRSVILASTLAELEGVALIVDCRQPGCGGERRLLIRDLAGVYGRQQTTAQTLNRMRCQGCRQAPAAAWLAAGPGIQPRGEAVRVPLIGPEAVS